MDAKAILEKIKLLEIKTKNLTKQVFTGEYHSAFKGRGMTFSEVREYQTGDEIRTIDWNVTARFNEPFVKVFEEERELNILLLIDVSSSNDYGIHEKTKLDLALELAAVLSFSAIANNDKVGSVFCSDKVEKFIPPKKGRRHALILLRELSEQDKIHKKTNLVEGLRFIRNTEKKRSVIFVISDFLDDNNYLDALAHTRKRHDVVAIKISDALENNLPDLGIIPLQDKETGEWQWYNTSSSAFKKEMKQEFDDNHANFAKNLRKRGIDSIEINTTDNYHRALVELFHRRSS
jgi:uncharacterized protein (DUF58 family)